MSITINGNVTNLTNFEENGVQINIFGSPQNINLLYNDLEHLKSLANDNEMKEIISAQNSINEKNESKLLESLKKLVPFIGRVASSVTANVIVSYMRAKGLIAWGLTGTINMKSKKVLLFEQRYFFDLLI